MLYIFKWYTSDNNAVLLNTVFSPHLVCIQIVSFWVLLWYCFTIDQDDFTMLELVLKSLRISGPKYLNVDEHS